MQKKTILALILFLALGLVVCAAALRDTKSDNRDEAVSDGAKSMDPTSQEESKETAAQRSEAPAGANDAVEETIMAQREPDAQAEKDVTEGSAEADVENPFDNGESIELPPIPVD